MKNFLLLLLAVPFVGLSQIGQAKEQEKWDVIGVADKFVGVPKLSKLQGKDYYHLYYANLEYPNIDDYKSLFFEATPEELDYLYNEFMSQLVNKTKEMKNIKVGNATIYYKRNAASLRWDIEYDVLEGETSGWFYTSKKQLSRLFGKGKKK